MAVIANNHAPASYSWPQWAVGLALLAAILAVASKNMVVDLDLFHEMALFRQVINDGAMPLEDSFAYTETNVPVVHHEWATGAVIYLISITCGLGSAGVVAIKYILTFGIAMGCFCYLRAQKVPLFSLAILTPVALNLGGWMAFTNVRAQLFTLFFLTILLLLIHLDRQGKRWWIAVWIPLVVLWANIHGGVVSGLGLIGCYGFARVLEVYWQTRSVFSSLRQNAYLIVTGIATVAALYINPYGWEYVPYLIRAIGMDRPLIPEWNPIWQLETNDAMFIWLVSVAIAGWLALQQLRHRSEAEALDLFTPLALALTALMAAKHYRHGSLYAVTWICLVPPMFARSNWGAVVDGIWLRNSKWIGAAAAGLAIVAVGYSIQARFWELRVPASRSYAEEPILVYPVGPTDYLATQNFQGNLFVPFNLGAFVSWKLAPQTKVSIDSRYEVAYPRGALEQNLFFYHALEDWPSIPQSCGTDAILIPKSQPVAANLDRLVGGACPEWSIRFEDQEFFVLVRNGLADQFPLRQQQTPPHAGVFP